MLIRYFIERNNKIASPYIESTVGYLTPYTDGQPDFINWKCESNSFETEEEAEKELFDYIKKVEDGIYKEWTFSVFYTVQKYYLREPVGVDWQDKPKRFNAEEREKIFKLKENRLKDKIEGLVESG